MFHIQAKSPEDAEKGLEFIKELVELSKSNIAASVADVQAVFFKKETGGVEILAAGTSHFSKELTDNESIQRKAIHAVPINLCDDLTNPIESVKGRILIVTRGECAFVDKARKAQTAGAAAVIIIDNVPDTSADDQPMFAMSGDGVDDVKIPVVFLYSREGLTLKKAIDDKPDLHVILPLVFRCNRFLPLVLTGVLYFVLQISIMQMAGLKKRLETTITSESKVTIDKDEL